MAVLQRSGRRNDPNLVERILRELKTPALRQPPQVEEALGHAVTGLLAVIASMQQSVDNLESAFSHEFDSRRLAPIRRSAPGLGPITLLKVRKVRNKRLGDACHWWAFVTLTKSAGARAHYDKR